MAGSSCAISGDTVHSGGTHTGINQSLIVSDYLRNTNTDVCKQQTQKRLTKFLQLKVADIYFCYENIILGIKYFVIGGNILKIPCNLYSCSV